MITLYVDINLDLTFGVLFFFLFFISDNVFLKFPMLCFSVSEARAWCGNDNPLRGTLGQPMVTSGTLEAVRAPVVATNGGPNTASELHNMHDRHTWYNMVIQGAVQNTHMHNKHKTNDRPNQVQVLKTSRPVHNAQHNMTMISPKNTLVTTS